MQNAALAALGLNWRYLAFDVRPEQLRQAITGAMAMHWIGLNLTVPHKVIAMDIVDVVDEPARIWGAVNTVVLEGRVAGGPWQPLREFTDPPLELRAHGFNTDADAVARALRQDLALEPKGAKVLVLGSGGAGRTAALKLAQEGASELYLVNRTRAKAEKVAAEIAQRWENVKVSVGYPTGSVDLVLNGTSLGLGPSDPLPLDSNQFSLNRSGAVYDRVYRPAETPLLRLAKSAGCRSANGLSMLLYQGARALELWTGQEAPLEAMRRALEANVYG